MIASQAGMGMSDWNEKMSCINLYIYMHIIISS
jgi:hypothetical protein